jgi:hypothetical protein
MARRITASMLALLVGFVFVSASFAQDAKKDVKKDAKPAVTDTKAQTKKEPAKDAKKPAGPEYLSAEKDYVQYQIGLEIKYVVNFIP